MENVLPTVSNLRGVNAYALDSSQLYSFLHYLWSIDPADISKLFGDPGETIVALRVMPYIWDTQSVSTPVTAEPIKWAGLPVSPGVTGYPLRGFNPCALVNPPFADCVFRLGACHIAPLYNSFLDYAPHTRLDLWLPYIGFVELDPALVMGQNIAADYSIDLITGACECFIKLVDSPDPVPANPWDALHGNIIQTASGTIGLNIPLTATNAAEISKNILSTGMRVAGGIATAAATGGAAAPIAASLTTSAVSSIFTGSQYHISKGQPANNFAYWTAPQVPFIIRTAPEIAGDAQTAAGRAVYNNLVGMPAAKMGTVLSALSGFVQVAKVHAEGFTTAFQAEVDEIERLLLSGVIM